MARPPRDSHRLRAVLGAAVTATVVLAGCSGGDVTAAAFPQPQTTLRIAVPDQPGRYSYEVTEEYARRVSAASGGTLTVEVEDLAIQEPRWNQRYIDQVRDGSLDLLVVQSQAFDTMGVDTFTALYVPFLIADEEHLDAVLAGDLADELLAGLEGTGLTGLAIIPGGMRHLFSDREAPTTPDDIAGEGVRVAYSETIWRLVEVLGGRPDDPNGDDLAAAFRDGRVSHLDSTFALADGFLTAPKGAADLSLYPLTLTIVAGDDVMADLSAEHQDLLASTAREVAQWAADTRPSEAADARDLCERNPGAQVVIAGADAVAQWRAATADLAAQLRADPVIGALADRIEHIGDETPPAQPVQPCSGAGGPPDAAPVPNVPPTFPEGVYRKDVTAEELLAHGVNAADAQGHAEVWTIDLRDGVFGDDDCPGSTYAIVDERIVVTLGPQGQTCGGAAGQVLFSGGWLLEGDSLTFTDVRSGHGADVLIRGLFGGEPWTRIG